MPSSSGSVRRRRRRQRRRRRAEPQQQQAEAKAEAEEGRSATWEEVEAMPGSEYLHVHGPTAVGMLKLMLFLGLWCGSALVLPAVVYAYVCCGSLWPALGMLGYYAARYVWPAVPHTEWVFPMLCSEDQPALASHALLWSDVPEEGEKFLLGFHPHGILCVGWDLGTTKSVLRKYDVVWLVSSVIHCGLFPFFSDLLMWTQTQSIARANMERHMKDGRVLGMLPGGFEEATLYRRHHHRVFLSKRKGFIKLALTYGYTLRPIYSFGEEQTFFTLPDPLADVALKLRLRLNAFGIPGACAIGWLGTWMPYPFVHCRSVVGKGIKLPETHPDDITQEMIDHYHSLYKQELVRIFDRYKAHFVPGDNPEEVQLEVW